MCLSCFDFEDVVINVPTLSKSTKIKNIANAVQSGLVTPYQIVIVTPHPDDTSDIKLAKEHDLEKTVSDERIGRFYENLKFV